MQRPRPSYLPATTAPPASGNGSYSCGVLAVYIEGSACVRLHVPPPLDIPLAVIGTPEGGVRMSDGDTLVGTAVPAPLELDVPPAPSLEQAQDAVSRYPCYEGHVFPTCVSSAVPAVTTTTVWSCSPVPSRTGACSPVRADLLPTWPARTVSCVGKSCGRRWIAPAISPAWASAPAQRCFLGKPRKTSHPPVIHHSVFGLFVILSGKWKLVLGNGSGGRHKPRGKPFGKPYLLFDLGSYPSETKDLASAHPDVVRELVRTFEVIRGAKST